MSYTLKGQIFHQFYISRWTDEVGAAILGTLATLGGRFALEQREIAIAWKNDVTGVEGWNRSQVFRTWQEALAYLRRDCLNVNFGAIFGHPGKGMPTDEGPRYWERQHTFKEGVSTPRGEMVLDIDLDYRAYPGRSFVCDCGERRQACAKCWAVFMIPAQLVMNALLDRMGFRCWFVVFSGRRGLHYWLCDEQVIQMTASQRKLFVETINKPPSLQSEWGREVMQILEPYTSPQNPWTALYPKIDVPVGADATHLHGVPLTLHPETQVFRRVIARGELFDFETGRWTMDDLTPQIMREQTEILLKSLR